MTTATEPATIESVILDDEHAAMVRLWTRANPERSAEVHRAFLGHCRATARLNAAATPIPGADDARAEAALMSRSGPGLFFFPLTQ